MVRSVFTDNVRLKLLSAKRKGSTTLNSFAPEDIRLAVQEAWQAAQAAAGRAPKSARSSCTSSATTSWERCS